MRTRRRTTALPARWVLSAQPRCRREARRDNPANQGDFNGDGKADLLSLVQNNVGGLPERGAEPCGTAGQCATRRLDRGNDVVSISAVLGNGDGSFKPAVLTTVLSADPILVGDVNGDGKDDVVQVHPFKAPSTVDVWLSNGDGSFTEGQSYQVSQAPLQGGILTDLDGDGKLDLLAVDTQTPGLVRTLLGNGDGTFQAATSVTLSSQKRQPTWFLPISMATEKLISPAPAATAR